MKLGYSTWGMPTVSIDTAIEHLAGLGFEGMELTVIPGYTTELSTLDTAERKRIIGLLKQHRLELPALAAHSSLMELDPAAHARNMQRLKGAVDLAVELAIDGEPPAVGTTTGGKKDTWDEHKQMLVERVGELVAYAAERGVMIGMEPHVSAAIDTPAKMLELLDLVNSPFLKVHFDISHFEVVGMPMEETIALLAPHSIHTHVKDERGLFPNFEFLIPGEGEFDYVKYLKLMDTNGYTGYITTEVSIMVQRRPNYDPLAAAAQSYATLARAFEEAGVPRERVR